ncbi:hypothetical protein [Psychroserpens luteus]|uniref:Uncharacterized protein n=1 Tax=Psychroserpens luteus TaxID=1434066 RepID=A0ABW5ZVT9_9FLAO|nr:hypothetical protein [Psychroserpens luteus]
MNLLNSLKKEKKKFPKMVVLYLSSELNKILIAPQYVDESWIRFEQEEIEILDFNCSNELLGESIKKNFDKFAEKNMADKKRTSKDWPAYQASNLKSIKEFEKKYYRISINGSNETNATMVFEADMKSENNINLTSLISAYAKNEKLGILTKELNEIQLYRKF